MRHSAEHPWASRYSWEIWLRVPCRDDPLLAPEGMTVAEQMFFLGAPLAHVVEFKKHLRTRRTQAPRLRGARLSRLMIRAAAAA